MLAALDALLSEGSVTGAARRLGLSTPAVSHALARLRERFGDELLVRAGRKMVLTPRAEALRGPVREAIEAASRVFEPAASFDPAAELVAVDDKIGDILWMRYFLESQGYTIEENIVYRKRVWE